MEEATQAKKTSFSPAILKIHEMIHTGEKVFEHQSTSLLFLPGFPSKMDGKFICPIQNGWEVYLSLPNWKRCVLLPFCNNFFTPIAHMEWPWKKPYKIKTVVPTINMKIHETIHNGEKAFGFVHCDKTSKNYYYR